MISDNLTLVRNNIEKAAGKAGRDPGSVTLIAVSKTKPLAMVEECISAGQTDFGENKPQELRDKFDTLGREDIRWHMIGHLQKNKIKYVIGRACLIHSVDSVDLAAEISRQAVNKGIVMPILLEVNIAGEESKFGFAPEETIEAVKTISRMEGVAIRGLMTIAPYVEDPEQNRCHFRNLRDLSIDIAKQNIDNVSMYDLSMGMTGDYEVAVQEGATFVRVGTGIFGERDYSLNHV